MSRLSYYDLYEAIKPEREGFEFNKPIVDVDPSLYKPVKTAYHDELSIFILSQDPNGDTDSEVLEVHTRLQKKIPNEQIVKLQQEEFRGIIKKVKKHKEKLSHLYTLDEHGILKQIIRENDQKREVTVVPRELTRISSLKSTRYGSSRTVKDVPILKAMLLLEEPLSRCKHICEEMSCL